jgi:hypothetical protein
MTNIIIVELVLRIRVFVCVRNNNKIGINRQRTKIIQKTKEEFVVNEEIRMIQKNR